MRNIPGDWYPGTIPNNVLIDPQAFVETSYSFDQYRSESPAGVRIGKGASVYQGTMFDLGRSGTVSIGQFALINGARIICDSMIEIGDYALISWNVVLMDTYRVSRNSVERRAALEAMDGRVAPRNTAVSARQITIGRNTWLGFDVCVLPGVTIGEGSIVGARSVVAQDIPPYTIAVGNPARILREIDHTSRK